MPTSAVPRDPVPPTKKPTRYVAVLFLVSTVSFMDRQILAILLEPIKHDLGASDTEMGLLTGFAFVLFFALASVPIARAADRYSRRNIIAVALTFWSVMTILSAYVASFLQLAAARVGLGIGEADDVPAAYRLVARLRGTQGYRDENCGDSDHLISAIEMSARWTARIGGVAILAQPCP